MHELALKEARESTFTTPLAQGSFSRNIQKMTSDNSWVGFVARMNVPFIRTPMNLIHATMRRSPTGFAYRDVRQAMRMGGAAKDEAIAKMFLGSLVMWQAAQLAEQDKLTGTGPANNNAKKALLRQGWQPFSVRVGDKWHQYGRLEPLGMQLGIAATVYERLSGAYVVAGDKEVGWVVNAAAAIGSNIMSKTWVSGANEFLELASDFESVYKWDRTLKRKAAGLVPFSSALRQSAGAIDPNLRTYKSDEGEFANYIKRNIPGLREELPLRLDLWGKPIINTSGFTPFKKSLSKPNAVDKALLRVYQATGYIPGMPSRVIYGVELSGEQYQDYVRLAGEPAYELLKRVVDSADFRKSGVEGQKKQVRRVIDGSRTRARRLMLQEYPDLLAKARNLRENR